MLHRAVDTGVTTVVARLWSRPRIAVRVAPHLFLDAPSYAPGPEKRAAFETLAETAFRSEGDELDYDLPYPKHEFLAYLSRERPVVFHGSTASDLFVLEPREQADYEGDTVTAVFATSDPVWPMFFAVVDQETYSGSLRNGGFVVETPGGDAKRQYFFSLSREGLRREPWREGTVYLLPEEPFEPPDVEGVGFDEWYSERPVEPLARLRVAPEDFPFLDDVVGHREAESIFTSWVCYRWRRHRAR